MEGSDTFGGKLGRLERGLGGLHARMALVQLGPTIVGGTDKLFYAASIC